MRTKFNESAKRIKEFPLNWTAALRMSGTFWQSAVIDAPAGFCIIHSTDQFKVEALIRFLFLDCSFDKKKATNSMRRLGGRTWHKKTLRLQQ